MYSIKPVSKHNVKNLGEYMVVHVRKHIAVFFGTKEQCKGWLERNGHDGDVE